MTLRFCKRLFLNLINQIYWCVNITPWKAKNWGLNIHLNSHSGTHLPTRKSHYTKVPNFNDILVPEFDTRGYSKVTEFLEKSLNLVNMDWILSLWIEFDYLISLWIIFCVKPIWNYVFHLLTLYISGIFHHCKYLLNSFGYLIPEIENLRCYAKI